MSCISKDACYVVVVDFQYASDRLGHYSGAAARPDGKESHQGDGTGEMGSKSPRSENRYDDFSKPMSVPRSNSILSDIREVPKLCER